MNSKFIVIEGLEGAGKSSAIAQVVTTLHDHGINDLVCTHEPGGTPLAESLRTLIKEGIEDDLITDRAELFMIYAARVQLVERVIKPALARGSWVIGDRYDLSSQAYQGGGRGIDNRLLKILSRTVLEDCYPDLTLYLDIPPEIGLARARYARTQLDRIEVEPLSFFTRIRSRYQTLAKENTRVATINANQPMNQVKTEISHYLERWLKEELQQ